MAVTQKRSKRKPTGGRYTAKSSKRKYELGSDPTFTKLDEVKKRTTRVIGANEKVNLLSANKANVMDPKSKKSKVVAIKSVLENTANRNYVRRNFLTMGAVIDTELGKAKITSRPGQEGTVNAVLL